ncbi:MAG TPA: VanZ family protein [Bryobacteraceae bacterium]|nr:VanZ family protein [Bryobacteraceae bacterium]
MKISEPRRHLLQRAWVGVLVLVVIGSLLPASSAPMRGLDLLHINDKVIHYSAYLVLSFLPVISFSNWRRAFGYALLMILVGVALEGLQSFSPGRTVDPFDAAANTLGVLSGMLAGLPLRRAPAPPAGVAVE